MKELKEFINERLGDSLKTHSKIFIKLLKNIEGVKISNEYKVKDYIITLKYDKLTDDFYTLLNFCNYFIQKHNEKEHIITIEARKPNKIDTENNYAYHITNSFYVDKILKYGLVPNDKSKTLYHDDRIYLWIFENDNIDKYVMERFKRLSNRLKNLVSTDRKIDENDNTILRIDLNKLKSLNKDITFYGDQATTGNNAVFTLDNIPPSCIEIYES